MRTALLLAAGLAVLATPFWATPALAQVDITKASKGYNYFHRAGADIDMHDAAVKGCLLSAAIASQTDPHSMGSGDWLVEALTPLLVSGIARGVNTNADAANVENCMVVRGWTVVGLDAKEGGAIAKLPADQQRAALAPWVGADQPHGTVLRRYNNDLIKASTRYGGRPGGLDKLSLSISAVGQMPDPGRPRVPRPAYIRLTQAGRFNLPLPETQWPTLGPNETLIVFHMPNTGKIEFDGLHLVEGDGDINRADGRIGLYQPINTIWGKEPERLLVFRVPVGRWRMDRVYSNVDIQSSLNLCLGSPGFDLADGEAIYGGSIKVLGDGRFVPDMDMAPARRLLAGNPDLVARLKPAAWMNGTTGPCANDSYQYALDIPGAPRAPAP